MSGTDDAGFWGECMMGCIQFSRAQVCPASALLALIWRQSLEAGPTQTSPQVAELSQETYALDVHECKLPWDGRGHADP